MKRILQLIFVFFVLNILVDLNEESIFVAGAFMTWFFLFEAIATALSSVISKELSDEFLVFTSLLIALRISYSSIKNVLYLLGRNYSFNIAIISGIFYLWLNVSVLNLLSFTENKVHNLLFGATQTDYKDLAQLTMNLDFVLEKIQNPSSFSMFYC